MNFTLVLFVSLALLALAIMQTCYVYACYRFLRQSPPRQNESTQPSAAATPAKADSEVALVLCLRGADPGLRDCLAGISIQQYPEFQLHVVIDSADDPAAEVVHEFFADQKLKPALHVIQHRGDRCSLKCSALLEAIQRIPMHIQIIAFIDADTVPDPHWLSDLVAPLAAAEVGATTGNRWFAPAAATFGGYVRKIWNAAAIVQMDLYNIAWGGSLAIKRSVIDQCKLPESWRSSFCEDTLLSTALKQHGFNLVRVPNLISTNTESSSVGDSFWWIVRQLLTVRLYHPAWPLVKMHGLATTVGSVLAPLGLILLICLGDQRGFYWLLAALISFQFWNLLLLWMVERANVEILASRTSETVASSQPVNWPLQILAYLMVQLIQPLACLVADRARSVRWRGINYEVDNQEIRLREYVPFRKTKTTVQKPGVDSLN